MGCQISPSSPYCRDDLSVGVCRAPSPEALAVAKAEAVYEAKLQQARLEALAELAVEREQREQELKEKEKQQQLQQQEEEEARLQAVADAEASIKAQAAAAEEEARVKAAAEAEALVVSKAAAEEEARRNAVAEAEALLAAKAAAEKEEAAKGEEVGKDCVWSYARHHLSRGNGKLDETKTYTESIGCGYEVQLTGWTNRYAHAPSQVSKKQVETNRTLVLFFWICF